MGHATTVKSKNNQSYTVSTVYQQKFLNLKDLKEPVFVVCEAAIYKGKPKPLRTSLGKKPFLIAFNIYEGLTLDIEDFHELVVKIIRENSIKTPEDFTHAINENDEEYFDAAHVKSRQLFSGFKEIDLVYIVSTTYAG